MSISFPGRGVYLRARRNAGIKAAKVVAPYRRYDISVFHEFAPPPAGGGHQFLRALIREWERSGLRVEINQISATTRACLFNSYNFDSDRLRQLRRADCRMIHRVDGPLCVYRGFDDGTDQRIAEWNRDFADATIMQSQFSKQSHDQLGLGLRNPVVIANAADAGLFSPPTVAVQGSDLHRRKVRIISTSWSDNPNKGADVYGWLDQHLDFSRYEYTFAGRINIELKHINVVSPLPSAELAKLLRKHDLFLAASLRDPCSNSLIEALACGLPVIYRKSGGHPELVNNGGLGFDTPEQIPFLLDQLVAGYDCFRAQLPQRQIREVAQAYLSVMLGS